MKHFYLCLAFAVTIYVPTKSFAQQPFTNIQQSPTVSPYLNLSNGANRGQATNYQSLVRPLLQQQQTNQQQARQIQHLAQAQKDLTTGGLTQQARGVATSIRGTGHVAGFMINGNYFPQAQISTNDPITRRLVTLDYTH